MTSVNVVGPEIAGAMARFWTGGRGPSHASVGSAFALAGYEEPDNTGTKEARVLYALRNADDDTAKRLVEELLGLLRSDGEFDGGLSSPPVASLQKAFDRRGFSLSPEGYVDWTQGGGGEPTTPSGERVGNDHEGPPGAVTEVAVPNTALLASALRRLAPALRPLIVRRRNRVGIDVKDEYDLQDFVEALLRSLYNDVRAEERTPSYAGSSSVIDFLLRDDAVAVEVKVTAGGRSEKHIKQELLIDIYDYQQHPRVRTLIAVVYDLASTFNNPAGFERDLSGRHRSLDLVVLVVGWPIPRTTPA